MEANMEAEEHFKKMRAESQEKVIELFKALEAHPTVEGAVASMQVDWLKVFGPGYKKRHMLKLMTEFEERKKPLAWFPNVSLQWMESNKKGDQSA